MALTDLTPEEQQAVNELIRRMARGGPRVSYVNPNGVRAWWESIKPPSNTGGPPPEGEVLTGATGDMPTGAGTLFEQGPSYFSSTPLGKAAKMAAPVTEAVAARIPAIAEALRVAAPYAGKALHGAGVLGAVGSTLKNAYDTVQSARHGHTGDAALSGTETVLPWLVPGGMGFAAQLAGDIASIPLDTMAYNQTAPYHGDQVILESQDIANRRAKVLGDLVRKADAANPGMSDADKKALAMQGLREMEAKAFGVRPAAPRPAHAESSYAAGSTAPGAPSPATPLGLADVIAARSRIGNQQAHLTTEPEKQALYDFEKQLKTRGFSGTPGGFQLQAGASDTALNQAIRKMLGVDNSRSL